MRVLLVAYDYPPTQSPRALRWRYLSRELALAGHDVHVLVPDLGPLGIELPEHPGRVVLHRSFPGFYGWLVQSSNRRRSQAHCSVATASASRPEKTARLNWRGRLVDGLKRLAGLFLFPDVRGEWGPWARHALSRLLREVRPDVVITSHEPASTLPLGIEAQRQGFAWVADLGDPVCAAYTPPRWRRRAMALEAVVSARADHVFVTNQATKALLVERHGQRSDRCTVLPNGYDDRRASDPVPSEEQVPFDDGLLELVYAGRFYGYRDPAPLLQALASTPGVRLTLVVPDPPTGGAALAAAGDRLRILGPMAHEMVLDLLQRADVLVNFGDRGQRARTPAKLFEYFGIARPILHVHDASVSDAATDLLGSVQRGWLCDDDADALAAMLSNLLQMKQRGELQQGLELAPLPSYGHSSLGTELARILTLVAGRRQHDGGASLGHVRRDGSMNS